MDYAPQHQGRSACPWLIRRFVDPAAVFMFVAEEELLATARKENAIPFDAPRLSEVKLNHRGERCTFEAVIEDYQLNEPGLKRLALIVRVTDTNHSSNDQLGCCTGRIALAGTASRRRDPEAGRHHRPAGAPR